MRTSKEVIQYLKNVLNKENYLSMFTAGSLPEELIPESDLDIFIVMRKNRENKLLDNLTKIMDKFTANDNSVTYSFFRGPLKYKHKGLIHFIIYSEERMPTTAFGDAFKDEIREVLRTLVGTAKIIGGKDPKTLFKNIDLRIASANGHDMTKLKHKYNVFLKKNYIKYREWKKTRYGWRFTPTRKYASTFLRKYLIHYFKKNNIA